MFTFIGYLSHFSADIFIFNAGNIIEKWARIRISCQVIKLRLKGSKQLSKGSVDKDFGTSNLKMCGNFENNIQPLKFS